MGMLFNAFPIEIESKILFLACCSDWRRFVDENTFRLFAKSDQVVILCKAITEVGNHFMNIRALDMPIVRGPVETRSTQYGFDTCYRLGASNDSNLYLDPSLWLECLDLATNRIQLQRTNDTLCIEWCHWLESPEWRVMFGSQVCYPKWSFTPWYE